MTLVADAFLLRGSGTSANISSKWREKGLVMIHLKSMLIFRVKYSRSRVKSHATFWSAYAYLDPKICPVKTSVIFQIRQVSNTLTPSEIFIVHDLGLDSVPHFRWQYTGSRCSWNISKNLRIRVRMCYNINNQSGVVLLWGGNPTPFSATLPP